jgi:hypothetical protein
MTKTAIKCEFCDKIVSSIKDFVHRAIAARLWQLAPLLVLAGKALSETRLYEVLARTLGIEKLHCPAVIGRVFIDAFAFADTFPGKALIASCVTMRLLATALRQQMASEAHVIANNLDAVVFMIIIVAIFTAVTLQPIGQCLWWSP